MRIGLVTDTYLPDINGVVSSTVTLKKALEKAGHTVFVITNHAKPRIEFQDNILRLPGVRLKSLYGYKLSFPINRGASSYIENMNLDVVHLQTNFGVGIYGQYIARSLNIPLVDTYHTMYTDYTHYINPKGFDSVDRFSKDAIKAASRAVCNNVQAVVAPSMKTREALIEYGVLAPIYVVPTGLDLEKFSQVDSSEDKVKEIRSQVTDHPEATILVFIGRLAKEKSLEIPIAAIAANTDPNVHLAIVGGGPDEYFYKNLVKTLNVQDRVHFLGTVQPEEIAYYYKAFDAFVSASLSETQGMTYLEAMAAQRMVFGRRDEVLSKLLEEGKTGFYFDSIEELNEKIAQFQTLSQEEKEQAGLTCQKVIQPYTAESFAYAIERVYEHAIEDYSHTYVVEKIQYSGNFVFLTLSVDASKEDTKLLMPLEDFWELKITLQTKLDAYMVRAHLDLQDFYWCMYKTEQRLASKEMTHKQVIDYCVHKLEMPLAIATQCADELVALGRVNDHQYALDKADYYHSIGSSKRQIEQKLYKAGVSQPLIQEACRELSADQELSNAKKLAKRLSKSLKSKSARYKRQDIINKLIGHGYSLEAAKEAAEELRFSEDHDSAALHDAYEKAVRLYATKPEKERLRKMRAYCLRQGFSRQDIEELFTQEEQEEHVQSLEAVEA